MNRPPLDPRTVNLLQTTARIFKALDIAYTVGGGMAVLLHGVSRHTNDVDVFLLKKDRAALFAALRKDGLLVAPVMDPYHYMAWRPEHNDPRIRIDLLFPEDPLEKFTVRHPQKGAMWDAEFNVTSPAMLAAIKFMTGEARHRNDALQLLEHGATTKKAVYDLLQAEDPKSATRFVKWLNSQESISKKNPRKHPLAKRAAKRKKDRRV